MFEKKSLLKRSLLAICAVVQASSFAYADADQSKKTITASGVTSAVATIYSIKKLKYAEQIEAKNTRVILDFPQSPQALDEALVSRVEAQATKGDVVTLKYQLSEVESRERFIQIAEKKLGDLQTEGDKLFGENKIVTAQAKYEEASRLREEINAVRAGKAVDPVIEVARIDTKKVSLREFLADRAEKGSKVLNVSSVARKFSVEFSKLRGKVGVAVAAAGVASVAGIAVYSMFGVESVDVTEHVTVEESDLQRVTPYVRPNEVVQ